MHRCYAVTPHAGVWIETPQITAQRIHSVSLPMRECGLKPPVTKPLIAESASLPMRECGLKRRNCARYKIGFVTPHAGVWIETNT